jgi:spermidine/putrescine transport system permease protein
MVYNFLPYMLLPIYSVMSKINKNLVEASEDLGCNKYNTLVRVIFPLSVPGIVSGVTMVFVPSVSTFYISQQLGPTDFTLIGDVIESEIKTTGGVYNYGSAISFVLMILIFICIAIMNKFSDEDAEEGVLV